MTILSPNDPWPQYYFRRRDSDGFWQEGNEDKKLYELTGRAIDIHTHDYFYKPTIIFLGPRAKEKMKEEIYPQLMLQTSNLLAYGRPEYMGMNIVFTLDDGLWIA